jgi:23S rRNA (guanine745-N1)-methyltransferase
MIRSLFPYLRCPVCREGLAAVDAALRCPRGHSFDEARQGYVHLAAGPVTHPGDSAAMVQARSSFLAAGHYAPLARELARMLTGTALTSAEPTGKLVLDSGAGTGYYLGAVLDALPGAVGLAVDVSKPALRRAARAHPRAGAVLADVWRTLPVGEHVVDVLLNVFAPRNGPEFARVLAPGGALLVVTPTAGHLAELVDALTLLRVDPAKEDRVAASLSPWFAEKETVVHEWPLALSHADVSTLVGMGPSAWHVDPSTLAGRVAELAEPVRVTARVRVSCYSQVGLGS